MLVVADRISILQKRVCQLNCCGSSMLACRQDSRQALPGSTALWQSL
ncbi:hypothetical protein ACO0K9_08630 [Undibacterium sp. Ji50W]